MSEFALLTQLSRKQIQFSKIWLCHLLVCMTKYPHAKNQEDPLSRFIYLFYLFSIYLTLTN